MTRDRNSAEERGPFWIAYLPGNRPAGPLDTAAFPFGSGGTLHRFTDAGGTGLRAWFETEPVTAVRIEVVGPLAPAEAFRWCRRLANEIERAVGAYANVAIGSALEASMTVPVPTGQAADGQRVIDAVIARIESLLEQRIGRGEKWTGPGWCDAT